MLSRKLVIIKKNTLFTFLLFAMILVTFINQNNIVNAATSNENRTNRTIVIKDSRISGNVTNNNHSSLAKAEKSFGKILISIAEKLNIVVIFRENKNKKKTNFRQS